jgi:hypothetical protein
VSPFPCGQLLFEWDVTVRAPGRGHRAEVAAARGHLDIAAALIAPPLVTSDDPEYCSAYAEILVVRGDDEGAREAYADPATAFFMAVGNRPQRAVELAEANWKLRDTPRSRGLLARALRHARSAAPMHDGGERTATVEHG